MHTLTELPATSGTYVLLLEATETKAVQIGRFARLTLQPGFYYYVGSAFGPGGLRARVGRHGRRIKTLRWHVDFLRVETRLVEVWFSDVLKRREELWASVLAGIPGTSLPLIGFGASDHPGETHLVFSPRKIGVKSFQTAVRKQRARHETIQWIRTSDSMKLRSGAK